MSLRVNDMSSAKRKFAESLNEFKFQCIWNFSTRYHFNASFHFLSPLQEARKKYDKETEKYCSVLEKHLNLSSKKKESHLLELLLFSLSPIARSLQEFAGVLKNLEDERTRMIENASDVLITPLERFRKEQIGAAKEARKKYDKETEKYCSVLEKHLNLSSKKKESHLLEVCKPLFWMNGKIFWLEEEGVYKLPETPVLCFDSRPGVITMQALSEEDRRLWMEAMDGREPVYNLNRDNQSEGSDNEAVLFVSAAQLDSIGFNIIKKFIHSVETRGINEQGLYRIAGVSSRVQKLLGLLMDSKTSPEVDVDSAAEWEIKTITSALKHYLRMLPGPLMTYQFQRSFIKAASKSCGEAAELKLALRSYRTDEKELCVANNHQQNLMTVANLGVVFGPTLLRPQEETVAAIMDIKFQNIVIEILIENHEKIFNSVPESAAVQPNSQLNFRRRSAECKPPSCSERPLTLFHTTPTTDKPEKRNRVLNSSAESILTNISVNSISTPQPNLNSLICSDSDLETVVAKQSRPNSFPASPSPTSPRSPSWPMFSAPSSPVPASSTSSDSSPISPTLRKARALYACKAEHGSELSFIAGTIFDNGIYKGIDS
ncbi:UNVERIFIED_CONTAM: hypothetical protein FKN15_012705 [Acipenser sinensis]